MKALIKGQEIDALLDSGSSVNFVSSDLVESLNISTSASSGLVYMESSAHYSAISSQCILDITLKGVTYAKVPFMVLPDCCADIILGLPFLSRHSDFSIHFGGPLQALECSLATFRITPPRLFTHLSPDCRPIVTRSRRFNSSTRDFIKKEVARLLQEGIIEPSSSPWRAQVHVVEQKDKRRRVVDYFATINRFTFLDAYPLPNIEDLVDKISQYKIFSTIDLKSAYHGVPLHKDDKIFTAFETDGKLYQFSRLCFGLTNGVSCFQRVINDLLENNGLQDTFAYLDDVTVCGRTQKEHDVNLRRFKEMAQRYRLTYN